MKRLTWALAAPPMLVGVLTAHALAFRLTVPSSERSRVLADTGHAWFHYVPFVLGVGAAVLVVALVRRVAATQQSTPVAWPFGLFPPLALFLQEQIERGGLALDATIVAAALLAVPFGLLAYVVLRALLGVTDALIAVRETRVWGAPPTARLPTTLILLPSFAVAPSTPRGPPPRAPR